MEVDTEIRSIVRLEDGRIDCEINHPNLGWIPFTADPNDVEPHGRAIWKAANARLADAGNSTT